MKGILFLVSVFAVIYGVAGIALLIRRYVLPFGRYEAAKCELSGWLDGDLGAYGRAAGFTAGEQNRIQALRRRVNAYES